MSISYMLKEGTKHLSGVEEAILSNIEACQQMAQITRTSLGPNGMKKMVINHLEKLFVTSDAATILKELEVVHPAAKMVVMASQSQDQEMGDATNLVIVLAGELLHLAEGLIRMGLHPSDIIGGYTAAGKKALELLEALPQTKCSDVRSEAAVAKYLRSTLAAKQYGFESLLAPLVAQACIQVLPRDAKAFNVDNVRVTKILGSGLLDTRVIKGYVVERDVEGTVRRVANARVAVFVSGFDIAKPETKTGVLLETADQLLNFSKGEEKMMEDSIKEIAASGATVVVSGGAIGELALHYLERHGIMAVKIPSKFNLRRLCKAVGATPLVRMGKPSAEELGRCDLVAAEEIGGTKVTIFRQDAEDSIISTVVVRASTTNLLEDIERAVDDGVNTFKALLRDDRFVAGAGAAELEVARLLQQYGDGVSGLEQYAIKKFAESLEVVPRTLAENAGQNSTEVLSSLYAAHTAGRTSDGINVEGGGLLNALDASILDHLATKSSAVRLATDAVLTILRVDQIIVAKPAGGPKPPKMGTGMDTEDDVV